MAEVYKAYQPSLDRYVAIKVMHAFLARDPDFLGRFEREAKSVAALQHPNIIQVHDFDVHNGMPYMVMEFVEGGTLKTRVENLARLNEVLPLAETVRIVREVGRALSYAHQRSMIHRDVKPANVLLGSGGRVILSDFGIAKILTGPSFTMSGATVGTPSYMSPEQSLGQPGDHRSDIYALGVVLYQLGTGQLPYMADTPMAVMLKQVNAPLPNPRAVRPDLPEGLERIILKALAKNPEDRFQTADEMLAHLDNLETAARLAPVPAPRPSGPRSRPPVGATLIDALPPVAGTPPPPSAAKADGRPWFLAMLSVPVLILLCLVLGVVGIAGLYAMNNGRSAPTAPTEQPTRRPTRTPAEPTEAPTRTPDEPTEQPTRRPTRTPSPSRTPEGLVAEVLFEDTFDENVNGWDVVSDDNAAREFRAGIFAIQVSKPVWFAWSNPVTDDMTDVHIAVEVRNTGDNDPAFGVICSYLNSDAFYFMGFGDDGFYAIARIEGDDFILLTSDENTWIRSDQIEQFKDSYQLEGSCAADGTLTLVVDGVIIDQVQDSDPYGAGDIGLFVQSFDNVPVEVEFDDLTVTALE